MIGVSKEKNELEETCLAKERIRILVVCNSKHHSRNILHLAESLARIDQQVEVFALCERRDAEFFIRNSDPAITKIVSFVSDKQNEAERSSGDKTNDLLKMSKSLSSSECMDALYDWFLLIKDGQSSKYLMFLLNAMRESSLGCYLRQKRSLLFYTRLNISIEKLFDEINPTVVFSLGDRHIDIEAPVIMVAKSRAVKIVIPYVTFSGSAGMIKVRQIEGNFGRWWPFSFYRLYAGFRLKSQILQGYFWQQPSVLFALKKLGCLSKNPWCIGAGLSDVVCVDNEHTSNRYQKEGVSPEKLQIIGDVSYDSLYEKYIRRSQLRKEIVKKDLLDQNKKILILALPQFAEQGILDWESHWTEVRYLVDQISRVNIDVIISLHPRVDVNDYAFLEKEFPVHIADRPLKDLLPIADVFVAANSSTVFWAVMCGIRTVIVDFYGLDSTMFGYLNTVAVIKDRASLSVALHDAAFGKELAFADDWELLSRNLVFDGRVINRYSELVHSLAVKGNG